jgi:hypothetical protein
VASRSALAIDRGTKRMVVMRFVTPMRVALAFAPGSILECST